MDHNQNMVLFFKPVRFQLNMSKHNDHCFDPEGLSSSPSGRTTLQAKRHICQPRDIGLYPVLLMVGEGTLGFALNGEIRYLKKVAFNAMCARSSAG